MLSNNETWVLFNKADGIPINWLNIAELRKWLFHYDIPHVFPQRSWMIKVMIYVLLASATPMFLLQSRLTLFCWIYFGTLGYDKNNTKSKTIVVNILIHKICRKQLTLQSMLPMCAMSIFYHYFLYWFRKFMRDSWHECFLCSLSKYNARFEIIRILFVMSHRFVYITNKVWHG